VEWAMTNDEYHYLGEKYGVSAAINYDHQNKMHNNWPLIREKDYSPVFIDLVDSTNQRVICGEGHPNDLISSYTMPYINQNLLMNSTDISSLRNEVTKHRINGVDDFKIKELFSLY